MGIMRYSSALSFLRDPTPHRSCQLFVATRAAKRRSFFAETGRPPYPPWQRRRDRNSMYYTSSLLLFLLPVSHHRFPEDRCCSPANRIEGGEKERERAISPPRRSCCLRICRLLCVPP